MAFYDRLKESRINSGFTQEQLAEKLGIAKSTLSGYESGNREPTMATVAKAMEILKIDANYLYQDEMGSNNPMKVSYNEMEHIKKYRDLDNYGKETVSIILDRETERSKTLRNLTQKSGYVTYGEMKEIWRETPNDPEELERMCPPLNPDDIKKRIG